MKVLSFGGGLGNQIFEYAFYVYMKNKYPQDNIYGHYSARGFSEHYGLEIDKWFEAELPPQRWYSTLLVGACYCLKKLIGNHPWVDTSTRECKNEQAKVFIAYKYSKHYVPSGDWLKWKTTSISLTDKNKDLACFISNNNTWFVHVRRGDYLSEKYKKLFDGCCPISYYEQALSDVIAKEQEPKFICFSDDIVWAKDNLPKVFTKYIDWNTGENSPIDMYLMSLCRGAIIANSTFSYWGACLGNKKTRVYYPKKWINSSRGVPDIFHEDWISY